MTLGRRFAVLPYDDSLRRRPGLPAQLRWRATAKSVTLERQAREWRTAAVSGGSRGNMANTPSFQLLHQAPPRAALDFHSCRALPRVATRRAEPGDRQAALRSGSVHELGSQRKPYWAGSRAPVEMRGSTRSLSSRQTTRGVVRAPSCWSRMCGSSRKTWVAIRALRTCTACSRQSGWVWVCISLSSVVLVQGHRVQHTPKRGQDPDGGPRAPPSVMKLLCDRAKWRR